MDEREDDRKKSISNNFNLNTELSTLVEKKIIPLKIAEKLQQKLEEKNITVDEQQLYNLVDDPGEKNNLYQKHSEVVKHLTDLLEKLNNLHKELTSTSTNRLSRQERLREKIGDIYGAVLGYSGKPTDSQVKRLDILIIDLNNKQTQLNNIVQDELPEINSSLKAKSIEPIIIGN